MGVYWLVKGLLVLAALTQVVQSDAVHGHGRKAHSETSKLSWSRRLAGNRLQLPRSAATHVRKREIELGALEPNRPHQACILPSGGQGRCRHLQYCIQEDFRTNFPRFLDYLCVIERSFVGVCCPDRLQSGSDQPLSPLAGLLPSIGVPSSGQASLPAEPSQPDASVAPDDTAPQRPKTRGCGVSTRPTQAPADGGQAAPGEWPWMAALLKSDDLQFCGGVLITDRHILTASHCLVNVKAEDLRVRLGEYDLESSTETRSMDFNVTELRMHKDFQKTTYENDIAILKLHRPATFNSYIWPVCLPPPDLSFENATTVVAGWGTLSFGGPASDVLMEVSVPVWGQEKCDSQYAQPIPDTMMCAGGYEGGKDACQGDSGGPLLYQMDNKRWTTIGVVSWGIRCGEPTHPGVYVRVNHFLPWIYKNCDF